MVLEYFTKKGKKPAPVATTGTAKEEIKSPVLTPADEDFLRRITAEDTPIDKQVVLFDKDEPSTDAQTRLMDGADQIPLPTSPPEADTANPIDATQSSDKSKSKKERRKSSYVTYIQKHLPFGKVSAACYSSIARVG